jgi:NAD(P)-dependent dehydrogenase (short-subunit alcohol dehydrogenase family)
LAPGNPFDVEGRVAVVTGASSGLGERFAEVLDAAGAHVVAAARRQDRLEALSKRLQRVTPVRCDVTSADDRRTLVRTVLDTFGRVDILVNNAGVSGPSVPAERFPVERWTRTIEVNLTSLFAVTQSVAEPMLEAGRGVVIHLASALGLVAGHPMMDAAYAASKGGVVNLTRELGAEWATRGVRVNAIAPGWFLSEMTEPMTGDNRSAAYVTKGCPLGRMGERNELDGALLFLASDASSYCIGQTITVDGGWTIR